MKICKLLIVRFVFFLFYFIHFEKKNTNKIASYIYMYIVINKKLQKKESNESDSLTFFY